MFSNVAYVISTKNFTTQIPYLTFVTTRVEEGLPFISTPFMELILWSIIARAQSLYGVTVSGLLFMANHLHILFVVKEPEDIVGFMDRIKTESSHAINRLLGRRKRTIWCEGYNGVPILTLEDGIKKFIYLYTNPQNANLVERISDYPGVSTWQMLEQGVTQKTVPWIHRYHIQALKNPKLSRVEQETLAVHLSETAKKKKHTFTFEPNAWFECFGVSDKAEQDRINQSILSGIKEREDELIAERAACGSKVLGRDALIDQAINVPYSPKKFGRKMWCICSVKEIRIQFINYIKELRKKGREVLERWRQGDYSARYPIGLFPPSFPKTANLSPLALEEIFA